MRLLLSALMLLLLSISPTLGQEIERLRESGDEEVFFPYHSIALILGHANVREGVAEGNKRWLGLPSWSLDYNYNFHPRWSIGLHTDLILEEFVVERHLQGGEEREAIERSFPVAPAVIATYKLDKRRHWGLLFGPGVEFASGESFFLTRVGIEYAAELPREWEILASLVYDAKWNAYDSFILGIGVAKAFGHGKARK